MKTTLRQQIDVCRVSSRGIQKEIHRMKDKEGKQETIKELNLRIDSLEDAAKTIDFVKVFFDGMLDAFRAELEGIIENIVERKL